MHLVSIYQLTRGMPASLLSLPCVMFFFFFPCIFWMPLMRSTKYWPKQLNNRHMFICQLWWDIVPKVVDFCFFLHSAFHSSSKYYPANQTYLPALSMPSPASQEEQHLRHCRADHKSPMLHSKLCGVFLGHFLSCQLGHRAVSPSGAFREAPAVRTIV